MKFKLILGLFLIIILLSFGVMANCVDGIDNDGDGLIDLEDLGCLGEEDASERSFGLQLYLVEDIEEDCFDELVLDYGETCIMENLQEMSWVLTYTWPTEGLQTCLVDYGYYSLSYDEANWYSNIALADCVYLNFNSDYATILENNWLTFLEVDPVAPLIEYCLQINYDLYEDHCIECETFADCEDGVSTCSNDGLCVTCEDSDGYSLYDVGSYLGVDYVSGEEVSGVELCVDENTVLEYECDSDATLYYSEISCPTGHVCEDGACVEQICTDDSECASGEYCYVDSGECKELCTVDTDCPSSAACVLDSSSEYYQHCMVCEEGVTSGGVPYANGVNYDGEYSLNYQACYGGEGSLEYYEFTCFFTGTNTFKEQVIQTCESGSICETGICEETSCSSDVDCSDYSLSYCLTTENYCVECLVNSDCDSGSECVANVCRGLVSDAGDDLSESDNLDAQEACISDADCDSGFECESGLCVEIKEEEPKCSDGIDNDNDGLIDYGLGPLNDPGCISAEDNSEINPGNFFPAPEEQEEGLLLKFWNWIIFWD